MRQPLLWVCCCRASLNASSSPAGFATTSVQKLWAWSMQHLALAAVHAWTYRSSHASISAQGLPAGTAAEAPLTLHTQTGQGISGQHMRAALSCCMPARVRSCASRCIASCTARALPWLHKQMSQPLLCCCQPAVSAVYAPAAARPWLHQAGCTSRRCHDRLQQSTRTQTISPSTISSTKTRCLAIKKNAAAHFCSVAASAASWAPCSGPWHAGSRHTWRHPGSSRTPCGSRSARTAAAQPQMGSPAVGCHPGLCTAHEREEAAASTS
ncbi:hypothetical protein COO60DRAFT_1502164 [Scenedesmus sp. NREL 46B-D3]|nr:hypothetical protein COO60DRAFT_1502164 [Scenedesmus sp. NREL 46B-D3]